MARRIRVREGRIYEYNVRSSFFSDDEVNLITDPSELTFPHSNGRANYQEGDFIFSATISKHMAALMYKEFESRLNEEYSWGDFILHVLDLSDIQVVKKILTITGDEDRFSVRMTPYLKLSDNELLQLHYRNGQTEEVQGSNAFYESWMWADAYRMTRHIIPLGEAVLTITTLPFGGAARTAGARIMAPLMRRFGLRIVRKILRMGGARVLRILTGKIAQKSVVFVAKVARDTVTKTVRNYYTQLSANQNRELVNPALVRAINLDTIISEAIRDSVADNITGEVVEAIGSVVPSQVTEGIFDQQIKNRITNYITRKILTNVLSPITELLRSSIMAVNVGSDERSYEERLKAHFEQRLKQQFSQQKLIDLVTSAFEDMTANPALIISG